MTAVELFSHYPTLQPFLSQQLALASQVSGDVMRPTLYPLLLLLSKLKPSAVEADDSQATADFLTSLHSLSNHPHGHARRMTAQAMVALTPVPRREATILFITQQLPLHPPLSSSLDYNGLDGRLLQLTELFTAWTAHPGLDAPSRESGVVHFIDTLLQRQWVGTSRMCVPTIRIAYVDLLALAVQKLSPPTLVRLRTLLTTVLQLSSSCCEPWTGPDFPGIGFASMRVRAAAVLAQTLLSAPLDSQPQWRPHTTAVFQQLFNDEDDGVKESALKVFRIRPSHQPAGPRSASGPVGCH